MKEIEREIGKIYSDLEIKKQYAVDKKTVEDAWINVEKTLCDRVGASLAGKIVAALKELYTIFDKGFVDWLGNLYDPNLGGFYYSNSARDNEEVECEGKIYKLLPDLESTTQAISVVSGLHMADLFDKDPVLALPEWMKEKIIPFVKNMQDETNGYFYHPQWGKEHIDKWTNRRGRDLTWATRILDRYGEKPLYKTPLEDRSKEKEVAKVETAPQLIDKESFLNYLNSLGYDENNAYSAYVLGNRLESQAKEIVARDKELEREGAGYQLKDVMKEWLDERYNPENGTWTKDAFGHDSANGILKIASSYIKAGVQLPDPIASIKASIACVTLEKQPEHVCCVLNPWYALNSIVDAIKESAESEGKTHLTDTLEQMRSEVIKNYPEMILKTAENLKLFKRDDGSFSYFTNRTSHYSQMMPVSIHNATEGDLNASLICASAIPNHIFAYLGLTSVPMYAEADRMRLVNILQTNYEKGGIK